MLNRNDISRILNDLFRTELATGQTDSLAVFDVDNDQVWKSLPEDIKLICEEKSALIFGYMMRSFSSFERMTDYAYASYLKNQQINFLMKDAAGATKIYTHTTNMVWDESRALSVLFKPAKRIVSLVPTNYFYGFMFAVILPHALQIPVVTLPALPVQSWQTLLQSGDVVIGIPLFWNYWLRGNNHFPTGVCAVSSTELCPDSTVTGLLNAGAERFIEIYGSTQTGSVAWREKPNSLFEIFPFWDISLKEKEPLLRRAHLNFWQHLPDHAAIKNERFLYPTTRFDTGVKIAGITVYPKRVEAALSSHPAVKACRVRLMRPEEGNRLKAFIVLNEGFGPEQIGEIRSYLNQYLTAHEIPRTFTFGEMLPTGETGKETDW